jgi:hypothetical protein
MTGKKKILILCFILLSGAAAVGYYLYNKGPENVRNRRGTHVEAETLYNSYIKDSSKAQEVYTGEILAVSGVVDKMDSTSKDATIVLLTTGVEGGYINCTLDETTRPLAKNEKVTIKGICSGLGESDPDLGIMGDVYLTRCLLVQ